MLGGNPVGNDRANVSVIGRTIRGEERDGRALLYRKILRLGAGNSGT